MKYSIFGGSVFLVFLVLVLSIPTLVWAQTPSPVDGAESSPKLTAQDVSDGQDQKAESPEVKTKTAEVNSDTPATAVDTQPKTETTGDTVGNESAEQLDTADKAEEPPVFFQEPVTPSSPPPAPQPIPQPAAVSGASVGTPELAATVEEPVVNLRDYGGKVTLGVALGGGGLIGVPLRLYFSEKAALELGVYYRPEMIQYYGDDAITFESGGPMFAGGFDFFFSKRYVPDKRKIRLDGIFLKGGGGFGSILSSWFVGVGWAREMMHQRFSRYSFNFELGAGAMFNQIKDDSPVSENELEGFKDAQFLLYWKVHWSWALSKR